MAEETFEGFVARERTRLHGEREAVFTAQHELQEKLDGINRELAAIDAYEAAKAGKLPTSLPRRRTAGTQPRARSGSRRDALLKLIQASEGLTRGEILEQMGLKGNKAGEMSVSNALTALVKGNQVVRTDGRYRGV
jgi:hypothetical protein